MHKNRYKALIIVAAFLMLPLNIISTETAYADETNTDEADVSEAHGRDRSRHVSTPDNTVPEGYDVNPETQGKAKNGEYNRFFLKDDLQEVRVEISKDNLDYVLQHASSEAMALAKSVSIGGVKVENVGFKTKGNYTRAMTNETSSDRFSFTVNFAKYVKKSDGYSATQNFFGVKKISFNNFYFDKTMLKEYSAFKLFNEMGVPSSQYGLAKLYINNEYFGVYFMVEGIDESIVERHLNSSKVSEYLMKPQGISPRFKDADFGDCIGDDGVITWDSLVENGFIVQKEDGSYSAKKELADYKALWEGSSENFNDNIEMIPKVLTWLYRLTQLSNGKDFDGYGIDVNSQRYLDLLDRVIDTDEYLRYFATHSFIIQMDNMFTHRQNFALYVGEDSRSMLVPWDYDLSWGYEHTPADGESSANWNIDKLYNALTGYLDRFYSEDRDLFYAGEEPYDVNEGYPMFNVIYQNKSLRKKFHEYISDGAKLGALGGKTSFGRTVEPVRMGNAIDRLYDKLVQAASEPLADNVYYLQYSQPDDVKIGTKGLKKMVALRSVGAWLQANDIEAWVTGYGYPTGCLGDDFTKADYTTGGDKLAVVDDNTGIFAIADYDTDDIGPELSGTILDDSSEVKQQILKLADEMAGTKAKITVYKMEYTREPLSDFTIYIPVPSEKSDIYLYYEDDNSLEKPDRKKVYGGHTAAVEAYDFSYIVVAEPVQEEPEDEVDTAPEAGEKVEQITPKNPSVSVPNVSFNPKRVSIKKLKKLKGRRIKVLWKKALVNSGYEVRYAFKKSFRKAKKETLLGGVWNSTVIKVPKNKKICYVKIRGFIDNGKQTIYSKWSAVKKVKLK